MDDERRVKVRVLMVLEAVAQTLDCPIRGYNRGHAEWCQPGQCWLIQLFQHQWVSDKLYNNTDHHHHHHPHGDCMVISVPVKHMVLLRMWWCCQILPSPHFTAHIEEYDYVTNQSLSHYEYHVHNVCYWDFSVVTNPQRIITSSVTPRSVLASCSLLFWFCNLQLNCFCSVTALSSNSFLADTSFNQQLFWGLKLE